MNSIHDKTNEELVQEFKDTLSRLSYYHAAEGRQYLNETTDRLITKDHLKMLGRIILARGIDPINVLERGNYLVDKEDLNLP